MRRAFDVIDQLLNQRGLIRPRELAGTGISRTWLHIFTDFKMVQRVAPAVFGKPDHRYSPVAIAAKKIPEGVVCLTSALALHEARDAPAEVWMAIPRSVRKPKRPGVPIRYLRLGHTFYQDIETVTVDGVQVRVYSLERATADCRRFASKLSVLRFERAARPSAQSRRFAI